MHESGTFMRMQPVLGTRELSIRGAVLREFVGRLHDATAARWSGMHR